MSKRCKPASACAGPTGSNQVTQMFPVPKDIVEKLITIISETPKACCDSCNSHHLTNIVRCVECGLANYICNSCTNFFVKDALCPCCKGYWCRECRERLEDEEDKKLNHCDVRMYIDEVNISTCWDNVSYCSKCLKLLRGCRHCGIVLNLCCSTTGDHFVNMANYEDWMERYENACSDGRKYQLTLKKSSIMIKN